jgi:hypothetical protein
MWGFICIFAALFGVAEAVMMVVAFIVISVTPFLTTWRERLPN